jgi:hypothetical protein
MKFPCYFISLRLKSLLALFLKDRQSIFFPETELSDNKFNFQERFLLKCSILNLSSIKFNVQKTLSKGRIKETELFSAIILVRQFNRRENLLMTLSWLLVTGNSANLSKDLKRS